MTAPTQPQTTKSSSDWPAVVVALGILVLLGAVLVTATARWTAADLKEVLSALAPVLGVITGAFVTYFFTRHSSAAATSAAESARDTAERSAAAALEEVKATSERLDDQTKRTRELHNALTIAMGMVNEETNSKMRREPVINSVLGTPAR